MLIILHAPRNIHDVGVAFLIDRNLDGVGTVDSRDDISLQNTPRNSRDIREATLDQYLAASRIIDNAMPERDQEITASR